MEATVTTNINTNPSNKIELYQQIKQPAPNIQNIQVNQQPQTQNEIIQDNEKKYKIIKNSNVGIINLPNISKTPMRDTIEIKSKENPYTKYNLKEDKKKLFSIHSITFATVIICAATLINSLKKK